MILKFVFDVMTDPGIRDQFQEDPNGLAASYGLTDQEIALFLNHEFDDVRWRAAFELHKAIGSGKLTPLSWEPPDPPSVGRVDPSTVAPSATAQTTAFGSNFYHFEGAFFRVRFDHGGREIPAALSNIDTGANPNEMTVTADLQEVGDYQMVIYYVGSTITRLGPRLFVRA